MTNYDSFEAGLLMEGMTSDQKLQFHREMTEAWRDPKKAARLKRWFGMLGAHHFYLGDRDRGMKYLLFVWTTIPTWLCIFDRGIKKRTERLNSENAARIAMRIKGQPVATSGVSPSNIRFRRCIAEISFSSSPPHCRRQLRCPGDGFWAASGSCL